MERRIRVYNRREDKAKRQTLRQAATPSEQRLWEQIRDRRCAGLRFRRQYGVGPYVLDFYCPAARLAVELDGASHDSEEAQAYDAARTDYLSACGIRVLRALNQDATPPWSRPASLPGRRPTPSRRGKPGPSRPTQENRRTGNRKAPPSGPLPLS